MIDARQFAESIRKIGITFAVGVPDSLLKELSSALASSMRNSHLIAANEGAAVALAIGHYLSSGTPALVYMQNSGLGNAINPLISLADKKIYGIPMILFIGWRGEILNDNSQIKDEPQHTKQGEITLKKLDVLGINYKIVEATSDLIEITKDAYNETIESLNPVALVFRKNTFHSLVDNNSDNLPQDKSGTLSREDAIKIIISSIPSSIPVISTTGMASRELYEIRKNVGDTNNSDFFTVGGMGHASSIAQGIARNISPSKVICIDGDGALLMHMGSLLYGAKIKNYIHIVLNNGSHDSVGGQKTILDGFGLAKLGRSSGFNTSVTVSSDLDLRRALTACIASSESSFIEIKCKTGHRGNLGRPEESPAMNKKKFMQSITNLKLGT